MVAASRCRNHRDAVGSGQASPRAALALFCLLFLAVAVPSVGEPLLLTGAQLLNPEGTGWIRGEAVLVVDGRIARIAPVDEITVPEGTRTVSLVGLWLVPGLIDLHSHLLLHPYDETSWNDQVLKESLELRTIRAVTAARATLEAGFTTLRDLGTEGAGFADVALRDAIAQGLIPGPTLLTSTRAIVASGAYGPAGFDPRWEMPKGAQVADGEAEIRKAVREQIAAGADWIKVYADYRRRPGDLSTPTFSQAELTALVDEARSAGVPVSAHATTPEGIRRAVEAGVDTIEHGTGATPEVLGLMRERGVALCPTLAAGEAISRYAGWERTQTEPERMQQARRMFADALAAGVTLVNGSDVGVFTHGENARELELMVDYGMTPPQALAAATVVAAKVLGRDDLGVIAEGAVADLIALEGNVLLNISYTRGPFVVIHGGEVVLER